MNDWIAPVGLKLIVSLKEPKPGSPVQVVVAWVGLVLTLQVEVPPPGNVQVDVVWSALPLKLQDTVPTPGIVQLPLPEPVVGSKPLQLRPAGLWALAESMLASPTTNVAKAITPEAAKHLKKRELLNFEQNARNTIVPPDDLDIKSLGRDPPVHHSRVNKLT